MRSKRIYQAALKIENRFLLAASVMRAAKKLHIRSTRMQDTVNKVLSEVGNGKPVHGALPAITPPPAIDELLITSAT